MTSIDEKGLSYVPQILAAHQAAVTLSRQSLDAAIKCGELLIKAKEAVGHGLWSRWLQKHCPDISDRTARAYMQLADPNNRERIEEAKRSHGTDLGVRGARELLAEPKTEEQKAQAKATREANKAVKEAEVEAEEEAVAASIEEELQNLAPDEVLKLLTDAWETKDLIKLSELLTVHLKKIAAPAPISPPATAGATAATGAENSIRRM
jgi:hypothetical protein